MSSGSLGAVPRATHRLWTRLAGVWWSVSVTDSVGTDTDWKLHLWMQRTRAVGGKTEPNHLSPRGRFRRTAGKKTGDRPGPVLRVTGAKLIHLSVADFPVSLLPTRMAVPATQDRPVSLRWTRSQPRLHGSLSLAHLAFPRPPECVFLSGAPQAEPNRETLGKHLMGRGHPREKQWE